MAALVCLHHDIRPTGSYYKRTLLELYQWIVMSCPVSREAPTSTGNAPAPDTRVDVAAILEGIAAALEIGPNAFVQPSGPEGDESRVLAENAEALQIFAGITDRDARQRGLAYLRWIACNPDPDKGPGD